MMILDCTLRDGGYYTGWNFSKEFLDDYIDAVNDLELDAIEIGYCSNLSNLGHGEFYYCSNTLLEYVKSKLRSKTKLGVMLNAKEFYNDFNLECLKHKTKNINFVRIAADPSDTKNLELLVKKLNQTYEVPIYINFMYMHQYGADTDKINKLIKVSKLAAGISFVDSYGCMRPNQVKLAFDVCRPLWNKELGFHGHDNLGLVAGNSLEAINAGCDIVDCTFTGMGRGAGNMRTEDMALLQGNSSTLNDSVSKYVSDLSKMKHEQGWGSNFAYAAAAAKEIPQKQVMDILSLNRFSLNEVLLKVLKNDAKNLDFKKYLIKHRDNCPIVIGGGSSFKSFLNWRPKEIFLDREIVFISRKSLEHFIDNYDFKSLKKTYIKYIAPEEEIHSFKNSSHVNSLVNFECISAQKIQLNEGVTNISGIDFLLEKLEIKHENKALLPQSPLYTAIKLIESSNFHEALMIGFDGYTGKNIIEYETEYCFLSTNLKLVSPYATSYSLVCE